MSEMIDRCRVAVADVLQGSNLPVGTYIDSEKIVRAVIESMREPTQEMRLAGIAEYARPDPTPEHESTLVFNTIWRAMVDAALSRSP